MIVNHEAATIGELKASGYRFRSLREEIRHNLLEMIRSKQEIFPGDHRLFSNGYPSDRKMP